MPARGVFAGIRRLATLVCCVAAGGPLQAAHSAEVLHRAHFLVSDPREMGIHRLEADGTWIDFIPTGVRSGPMVLGDDGFVYTSAYSPDNVVVRLNALDGSGLEVFASVEDGLFGPQGLIFAPNGNLLVASTRNHRIIEIDGETGAFVRDLVPFIENPIALRLGPDGLLYAASGYDLLDRNVGKVDRYDPETGAHLGEVSDEHVGRPTNLVFGPDGDLYVANQSSSQDVVRIDPATGALLAVAVSDNVNPQGILFLPNGDLLLGTVTRSVNRYEGGTGLFLGEFAVLEGVNPASSGILRVSGPLAIDIAPGDAHNVVHLRSRRRLAVAILGSLVFDVADLDFSTLAFGPNSAAPIHPAGAYFRDVNRDGVADAVSHYDLGETGIAAGDTEACVRVSTLSGEALEGCDAIHTVSGCGRGHQLAYVLPVVLAWRRRRRQIEAAVPRRRPR